MARPMPSLEIKGEIKTTGDYTNGNAPWKSGIFRVWRESDSWVCSQQLSCNSSTKRWQLSKDKINKIIIKGRAMVNQDRGVTMHLKASPKDLDKFRDFVKFMKETTSAQIHDNKGVALAELPGMSRSGHVSTEQAAAIVTDKSAWKQMEEGPPTNKQAAASAFTSVLENRKNSKSDQDQHQSLDDFRFFCDDESERKENLDTNSPIKSVRKDKRMFLENGQAKSEQTLTRIGTQGFYGNTPAGNSGGRSYGSFGISSSVKRKPKILGDPATKRPRLSEDAYCSYSWGKNRSYNNTPNSFTPTNLLGFSNMGNTCYMNAILQSLFGLDTFAVDLVRSASSVSKIIQQGSLLMAMARLAHAKKKQIQSYNQESRSQLQSNVKKAISSSAKRFSGNDQHDAHEFLSQVLDQIKEEVIKVNKDEKRDNHMGDQPSYMQPDPYINPIVSNFEFEVLHSIRCLGCGEVVRKAENFHDLSLDMPISRDLYCPKTIQDALDHFFIKERIEYSCESCKGKESEVIHKFTRLPRVLVLHLKRYSFDMLTSAQNKTGRRVIIPKYITLGPHCLEETQPAYPPSEMKGILSPRKKDWKHTKEDGWPKRKLEFQGKQTTPYKFKRIKRPESDNDTDVEITGKSYVDHDLEKALELSKTDSYPVIDVDQEDNRCKKPRDGDTPMKSHHSDVKPKALCTGSMSLDGVSEEEQFRLAIEASKMGGADDQSDPTSFVGGTKNVIVQAVKQPNSSLDSCSWFPMDDFGDGESWSLYSEESSSNVPVCGEENRGKDKDLVLQDLKSSSNIDSAEVGVPRKRGHSKSETNVTAYSSGGNLFGGSDGETVDLNAFELDYANSIHTSDAEKHSKNSGKLMKKPGKKKLGWKKFTIVLKARKIFKSLLKEKRSSKAKYRGNSASSAKPESSEGDSAPGNAGSIDLCSSAGSESVQGSQGSTRSSQDTFDGKHQENATRGQHFFKQGETEGNFNQNNGNENGDTDNKENKENLGCFPQQPKEEEKDESKEQSDWLKQKEKEDEDLKIALRNSLKEQDQIAEEEQENIRRATELSLQEFQKSITPPKDERAFSSEAHWSIDRTREESALLKKNYETGELPYSYRLVSVVNHLGSTSDMGHYISDVFDLKKKKWHSFDDTHVTKILEEEVRKSRERTGYIFFYLNQDVLADIEQENADRSGESSSQNQR